MDKLVRWSSIFYLKLCQTCQLKYPQFCSKHRSHRALKNRIIKSTFYYIMFPFSGTFFQPFINGINTFFNPSQFRNPLTQFRDQQQQQQQPQQQQFTSFPSQQQQQQQPAQQSQQFGSSQQTFNFQDFRNNPTFQQDFQLTRFPQVDALYTETLLVSMLCSCILKKQANIKSCCCQWRKMFITNFTV